ncbi:S41 family peptidase [Saccharicrinis aurantiacus]|uniref:S41 family peptidase n=1 Tax=Saccharicrinis aurantiacus TaxID=1849719 RepID=UPI002490C91A|nr:S41 family peptidase [Saccharicrinis aurantiacus]
MNIKLKLFVLLLITIPFNQVSFSQTKELQKVQLAYKLISTFYVDSVNNDQLAEDAIVGMLSELDPHSDYLSKEEVSKLNEPLDGSFEGIGVQFNIFNDTLMVVAPISGGPSEKVGIVAGDRIVNIDGDDVAGIGLKNSDVFKYLKGKKGTKVILKVKRRGVKDLISFTVVRDKIPIHSVEAYYMATPTIGYAKINQFSATTHSEFLAALNELNSQGMKNLILDLRGNPGGYLSAAIDVSNEFLESKKLIVYTEGRTSPKQESFSNSKGEFKKGRVAVLIDEGSASASEIVSGALQDWDRAVIIGRRSFGKGLVQRPLNLQDGSMMRLTIAKYFTPSGRSIQKPYTKGNKKDYSLEVYERLEHGEGYEEDSIKLNKSEEYFTNNKRLVYGGGGIMPDIFVAMDTSGFSSYYRDIIAFGVLNRFILDYIDNHRADLETEYNTFIEFNDRFKVGQPLMDALIKEASDSEIKFDEKGLKKSESLMKMQIKALIARNLWDTVQYFEVVNPSIEAYTKAIELLNNPKEYNKLLN